jgi:hypothetical protein
MLEFHLLVWVFDLDRQKDIDQRVFTFNQRFQTKEECEELRKDALMRFPKDNHIRADGSEVSLSRFVCWHVPAPVKRAPVADAPVNKPPEPPKAAPAPKTMPSINNTKEPPKLPTKVTPPAAPPAVQQPKPKVVLPPIPPTAKLPPVVPSPAAVPVPPKRN